MEEISCSACIKGTPQPDGRHGYWLASRPKQLDLQDLEDSLLGYTKNGHLDLYWHSTGIPSKSSTGVVGMVDIVITACTTWSMCIAVLHVMVLFLWLLPFFVGQFF